MQISSVTPGVVDATRAAQPQNEMGKDAFLQLLVTQLRYQDPLSPMENEAFLAQLAQFSSLEQMQQMNENFEASMLLTQSLNNSSAAGLIGKHVRAAGDSAVLQNESSVDLGYYLPGSAASVTVTVYDSGGAIVRVLPAGDASEAGSGQVTWDGRSETGDQLPAGEYRFTVEALDVEGNAVPVSTLINGRVDGVTFENGNALLLVGGEKIPLSSVLEVSIPITEGGDSQ